VGCEDIFPTIFYPHKMLEQKQRNINKCLNLYYVHLIVSIHVPAVRDGAAL